MLTSKDKTKFRTSKSWKEFRKSLIKERGAICELCGTKYSGQRIKYLQVHHLDPDNYTDLNSDKFVLVCSSCHKLIERISKKVISKSTTLSNAHNWYSLLKKFLPYKIEYKLKEDIDGA